MDLQARGVMNDMAAVERAMARAERLKDVNRAARAETEREWKRVLEDPRWADLHTHRHLAAAPCAPCAASVLPFTRACLLTPDDGRCWKTSSCSLAGRLLPSTPR